MNNRICLTMIVKNEKKVIARCLNSVKNLIDYWVVIDTGSLDGTQDVVREVLQEIPGELHERTWVNFEVNRNEAVSIARNRGDYLLLMDADDRLVYPQNFQLPPLTSDYYICPLRHKNRVSQFVLLVNSRFEWRYIGVLHEGIYCESAKNWGVLSDVIYEVTNEGARSKDWKERLRNDIKILEEAIQKLSKDDWLKKRYLLHLAESYEFAEEFECALQTYKQRSDLGGEPFEVFFALYRIGVLQEKLNKPFEWLVHSYTEAYLSRPSRAEPLFCLARQMMNHHCDLLGYLISKWAIETTDANDCYDNEIAINEYGLLCQLAECASRIGKMKESIDVMKSLLQIKTLPSDIRKEIQQNLYVIQ